MERKPTSRKLILALNEIWITLFRKQKFESLQTSSETKYLTADWRPFTGRYRENDHNLFF